MNFEEARSFGWISRHPALGSWGCYSSHPIGMGAELGALAAEQNRIEEAARAKEAAAKAERAAAHRAWWYSRPKIFVRFGRCPASGKSRNHRDGITESGVSCYNAAIAEDGSIHLESSITVLLSGPGFVDRPAYEVRGNEVARGSDGEPVVSVQSTRRLKGRTIVFPLGWEVVAK